MDTITNIRGTRAVNFTITPAGVTAEYVSRHNGVEHVLDSKIFSTEPAALEWGQGKLGQQPLKAIK